MSHTHTRVTVLCISIALTSLVSNSIVAYILDRDPAIFDGPMFCAVSTACVISWLTYIKAAVHSRAERRDEQERVDNFANAVHYARAACRPAQDSGSFRRPWRED